MLLSAQKWHSPTSSKKDGCKETLLTFQLAIAKGALSLSEGRGLCLCASGIAEKGSWSKFFREQGKIVSRVQDTFVYMHAPWAAQGGPEIRTERVHISQPLCDDGATPFVHLRMRSQLRRGSASSLGLRLMSPCHGVRVSAAETLKASSTAPNGNHEHGEVFASRRQEDLFVSGHIIRKSNYHVDFPRTMRNGIACSTHTGRMLR